MRWSYVLIILGINAVSFGVLYLTHTGLAAHIIIQTIVFIGGLIGVSLFHKYKSTRFPVPSPQILASYRKYYSQCDFFAMTSRGKKGGLYDFSSNDIHPAQCFDHISALLMHSNREATFTPGQICVISASWATTMLKGCHVNNYPHIDTRYKRDMNKELCIGACYNGIYRALQPDFSPTDDVQWCIDNANVANYILNMLEYFQHHPAFFLNEAKGTLETLDKLRKYLKAKLS